MSAGQYILILAEADTVVSVLKVQGVFLAALAAPYLTLVSQSLSHSVPLLNFDTKSDF